MVLVQLRLPGSSRLGLAIDEQLNEANALRCAAHGLFIDAMREMTEAATLRHLERSSTLSPLSTKAPEAHGASGTRDSRLLRQAQVSQSPVRLRRDPNIVRLGINLEVRYWMQVFAASRPDLENAVFVVGTDANRVRAYLAQQRSSGACGVPTGGDCLGTPELVRTNPKPA